MKHMWVISSVLMVIFGAVSIGAAPVVEAHQPYCEEGDIGPDAPFRVHDPTVSTAFYATLFPEDDVDYLTFHGKAGQRILLGLTIPQIDGQEEFAPTFALFGPGLGQSDVSLLPGSVRPPRDASFMLFVPGNDAPESFYEPFSGTSYWNRQEARVTLPKDGRYTIAVWHDEGVYGRYVMVVGDREVIGGDIRCLMSLDEYFTPVDPAIGVVRGGDDHADSYHHADHKNHHKDSHE